jgi:threonylcarbamoyladenosine tRNA methylthiotransferase CDKAL1
MPEDIEDLRPEIQTRKPKSVVNSKVLKSNNPSDSVYSTANAFNPTASVYVKTSGCSHNSSDAEYMAGILKQQNYNIILESSLKDTADLWLLNSCTVKNPSQQTFENDIKDGLEKNIKVVVAGCVPQADKSGLWSKLSTVGVQQIDQVCCYFDYRFSLSTLIQV